MTDYSYPVKLIIDILSALSDESKITTVNSLTIEHGISINDARRIITFIYERFNNHFALSFDNVKSVSSKSILSGDYDDLPINIETDEIIALNSKEYDDFTSKKDDYSLLYIDIYSYREKDKYALTDNVQGTLNSEISRLWNINKYITLVTTKDNVVHSCIKILNCSIDYSVFYLDISDDNLSFIPKSEIIKTEDTKSTTNERRYTNLLNHIWSLEDISTDAEIEEVSFIVKNHPNPKRKIQYELSNREDCEIIQNSDGTLLVNMKIIVTDSFISWLLSYGSSITVINNDKVKNHIIHTYIEVYKKNS